MKDGLIVLAVRFEATILLCPDESYLPAVHDLHKRQAAVYSVRLLGAENEALPDRARLGALAPGLLSRA